MKNNMDLRVAAIREKQRRNRRKAASIIITVLFIILLVAAIVAGIFAAITALGGERLRSKVSEDKPNLVVEESEPDTEAILSALQGDTTETVEQPVWEEGWVRYNDKIYEYNEDILTFLVMGIDSMNPVKESKDALGGGQADGLFLVVVNPDDESVKIVAINRDTMTEVQMYGYGENGQTMIAQIAVQHGFGGGLEKSCELTRDAVSKLLYDLPIHGYVSINMGAISKINDAIGGVDVTVLEDMTKIKKSWTEGTEVTLEGKDAYNYVHWRDLTVFESNRSRLARQKQYLSAFVTKTKAATKANITLPLTLYSELSKYMVTDIKADEVAYLVSNFIDYEFATDSIYTLSGTTEMGEKHEEFYPDKDALKDLMINVFYQEVEIEEAE